MANDLRTEEKAGRALQLLQAAILILAGWWSFAPALTGGWVWDDALYLPGNPLLHDPARLWKTWFAPGTFAEYYPLTATVQFVQWSLWGNQTLFYHATNVVLHLVNALLVWRLFTKLGLRLAWLGGLIFAVHPLTVESVAWISELKNTLSLAPFLLAMIFYLDYEQQGREDDRGLALGLFFAAMLAKITMAPFPAVILLHAWWKRGRIERSDLRTAAPFLVISIVLLTLNVLAGTWHEQVHSRGGDEASVASRVTGVASSGLLIFFLAAKFVWPTGLSLIYPQFLPTGASVLDFLPWVAVAAMVGCLAWKRRESWCRDALLGLGFYLLMLTPVFGFIVMNQANMIWSLDHLAYLPMIGLIGLTVAGLGAVSARLAPRLRCAGAGALAVALAMLAWASHAYSACFQDEETLWRSTLARNPDNWVAHSGLGNVLQEKGRSPEAMAEYREALRLNPKSSDTHAAMALILLHGGHAPEALAEYAEALKISPNDPALLYNLGDALAQLGRVPEAIALDEAALKIDPDLEEAHYNLGNALAQTGRLQEAVLEYQAALRLNPEHGDAHANLGNALLQLGQVVPALSEYGEALRLNPDDADTQADLGLAQMELGSPSEARIHFETALRLDPHQATAQAGLARLGTGVDNPAGGGAAPK